MQTGIIVEDVPEARNWLSAALKKSFPGIRLSSAATVGEALEMARDAGPFAIALVDLGLPDGSGISVIEWLNTHSPQTLCIVASIFNDDAHIYPALRAGAQGYLLKDQTQASIVSALKGITGGQPPLSPAIAPKLLSHFKAPPTDEIELLTAREREVLAIIAKGLTMAEAARTLGISPNTVSGYVKDIYRKLNVSSRAEAALTARRMGLV